MAERKSCRKKTEFSFSLLQRAKSSEAEILEKKPPLREQGEFHGKNLPNKKPAVWRVIY